MAGGLARPQRRLPVLALVLGVLASAFGAGPAQADTDRAAIRYIVTLTPGTSAPAAAERHSRLGVRAERVFTHALSGYVARMSATTAAALRHQPGVRSVEADRPTWATDQQLPTGVDRVSLPSVAGQVATASTIDEVDDRRVDADIAVIDTGSGPHPDLDVVMRTDCTVSAKCTDGTGVDGNGHGTHVAGIAAALDNGFGTVGTAPGARIWSVRVLDSRGSGQVSWLVAGIDWATAHADRIDVANISISCGCVSTAIDTALSRASAAGITTAVAAGNVDSDASLYSISKNPEVLTVSALADFDGVSGGVGAPTCRAETDDTLGSFSNWGAAVDLAAPGVCIRSTYLGGGYAVLSGTSMASPHVAGAAALLASDPAYAGQPAAIKATLLATANQGWTDTSGDGVQEPLLDTSALAPHTVPSAAPVGVTVSDTWAPEGSTAQVAVRLTRPLQGGEVVTVKAATSNSTAVSGADYTSVPGTTLRFTAASRELTVPVATLQDEVPEGVEAVNVYLSAVTGATLADSTGIVSIVDSGGPLRISVDDASVAESATSASVGVHLSEPVPTGQQVTLRVATNASSATAGADFTALPTTTLAFAAGEQDKTVTVGVTDDAVPEGNESFSVTLSSPVGAVLSDSGGLVTILDDDGPITVGVSNAWLPEGSSGTTPAQFTVSLSTAPVAGQSVVVTVSTANSSATAGSDYVALPATKVTFGPGETTKIVGVDVVGDTLTEANETFLLRVTAATGAVVGDSDGVATIANDDGAVPAPSPRWLSIDNGWLWENGGAGSAGAVPVRLSSPPGPGESVRVTVASTNGTATAGADFVAVPSTTVVFNPGETLHTVAVTALDDGLAEPSETFTLSLSGAVGATVADTSGLVTVVSDEGPITASVTDGWVAEGDAGQTSTVFTVGLSSPPAVGQTATVKVATASSSATSGSDFAAVPLTTVTFGAGQTSATVTVMVYGDVLHEGNESIPLNLSAPVGLALADNQGVATVVDEEGPITASLLDTAVLEGASGSTAGPVTVSLSEAPQAGQVLTLKVASTTGGSATAGTDYTALPATTVTFVAGETTKTVTLALTGDGVGELDETVRLAATTPTGGLVLADASADLTIRNDD